MNSPCAGKGTTAWTHDFLNKKPWHPLNFRNQMRKWEAEEETIRNQKLEEANRAEFEAEQQYLQTLAHLPGQEAQKYREMQGVVCHDGPNCECVSMLQSCTCRMSKQYQA